jgi:hypothetical protein
MFLIWSVNTINSLKSGEQVALADRAVSATKGLVNPRLSHSKRVVDEQSTMMILFSGERLKWPIIAFY